MPRPRFGGMEDYQATFISQFTSEFAEGQTYGLVGPVGSGKSYAIAGAVSELVRHGRVRRVLLCVPSALVEHWLFRLAELGLGAEALTAQTLRLIREQLAGDATHWPIGVFVVSPHGVLELFDNEVLRNVGWDLLIFDDVRVVRGRLRSHLRALRTRGVRTAMLLSTHATGVAASLLGAAVVEYDWSSVVSELRANRGPSDGSVRVTRTYRREQAEVEVCAAAVDAARCLGRERGLMLAQLAASSANSLEAALLRWTPGQAPEVDEQAQVGGVDCRKKLEDLLDRVERLDVDSRLDCLQVLLQDLFTGGMRHVVVFTSYRTTGEYLAAAVERMGVRDWVIHGGMADDERSASIKAFREDGGMLVSSIAVPLDFVGAVIHYDLPMSPGRLSLLEEELQGGFARARCTVYLFRDEYSPMPNELVTYEMAWQFDPLAEPMEYDAAGIADRIWALVSQDSIGRELPGGA